MTPEQIEKWTRQASAIGDANELSGDAITEFARLVAAYAYEDAAKMCDLGFRKSMDSRVATGCARCAKAIRIRAEAAMEAKP